MRRSCPVKYFTDEKIEGTGRRVRRSRQLLSDVKERRTLEIERETVARIL